MHGIGNTAGVKSLSKSIHVLLGTSDAVAQEMPQQFTGGHIFRLYHEQKEDQLEWKAVSSFTMGRQH